MSIDQEIRRRAVEMNQREGEESGARDLTHDGLALDMGDRWKEDARHVAAWGRWYFWHGDIWRSDEQLEHMTRTRAFLREIAAGLGPEFDKTKRKLRAADTVAKVVSLARSNVAQAAGVDQWDRDPYQLGHPEEEDQS
jgi:putative DNA primase/helicase